MICHNDFLDCIRLSDTMMSFTIHGKTSFIFAQPIVHELVADPIFLAVRTDPRAYSMVRELYSEWCRTNDNRTKYGEPRIKHAMMAYLYSCATVPESQQMSIAIPSQRGTLPTA